ncbi:hypothetical protein [Calothrix sp. NIES-2098]|uniref:hypothetical protein n=1 Tax=Calothrix sp. NIES-2098 TaxID=1954171 RepID=UPI000B60C8F9|nr:hypothetical protein NIES2098_17040 [Calothrix sp. NIES-2098]
MSAIMQAIDRIAIYYAGFKNVITTLDTKAFYWMLGNGYQLVNGLSIKDYKKQLSSEELQQVVLDCYSPRLSLEQIKAITKDYPFELPIEIYDLYQRGNGCLPIGLDEPAKDWNCLDNYTDFSFRDVNSFLTLEEAIRLYQNFVDYRENYGKNIDPRWFPIYCFEDWILAVIGSENQQETSPVISFYDSDFIPEIEWPSLTNMLLTWIEIQEKALKDSTNKSEIEAIHQKYGREAGKTFW